MKHKFIYAYSPRYILSLNSPSYVIALYDTGPPPQYTPEDMSPEEPMLQHTGDLDLDDPSSLPLSERPPDLPPPMAMLPSNRPVPNNYHDPRKFLFLLS